MSTVITVIGSGLGMLDAVAPPLAARATVAAFLATSPRMPLRAADRDLVAAAERSTLVVRGGPVATYRWGTGTRLVLLVHGWRGRASQFGALVPRLVDAGFAVAAFDAPAHGESPQRPTDIRDWMAAIDATREAHGQLHAIVGHSFGALAALSAARHGDLTTRIATIAGAGTPQPFFDGFSRTVRLGERAQRRFEAAFRARLGESSASFPPRYDAIAHPLPPRIELLVIHDRDDRQLPADASERLVAAHGGRARLLVTDGYGHNRVLAAPETLDAVVAFVGAEGA